MMKKILTVLMCLALLASLCACSKEPQPTLKELDAVKKAGVLRIGVISCPPYAYCEDDAWFGFDISLAEDICRKLGVAPQFVELDPETRLSALTDGQVDCIWCGITACDSLEETVSFTQTYLTAEIALLVPQGQGPIQKTAVEQDSAAFAAVSAQPGFQAIPAASQSEAVKMVLEGKAQAAAVDLFFAMACTEDSLELRQSDRLGTHELAAAFRKDSDLVPAVNRSLTELEQSGAMENLAERYSMSGSLIVG